MTSKNDNNRYSTIIIRVSGLLLRDKKPHTHTNTITQTYWHFSIVYGCAKWNPTNISYAWTWTLQYTQIHTHTRHSVTSNLFGMANTFISCEAGRKALRVAILSTTRFFFEFNWNMNVAWNTFYHFILHIYDVCLFYIVAIAVASIIPSLAVPVIITVHSSIRVFKHRTNVRCFFFLRLFRSLYIELVFLYRLNSFSAGSYCFIFLHHYVYKTLEALNTISLFCVRSLHFWQPNVVLRIPRDVFSFSFSLFRQIQWNANNFWKFLPCKCLPQFKYTC